METFSQIREMDDVEDDDDESAEGGAHAFSKGIVWGYFEQAENTFKQMEDAM
jgi:osomolarity two-component system phosphorelay intermediate protein YPD1